MRKWTIWKMAVATGVICSVSAPQLAAAQGSGSVGTSEPAASPQTNVTSGTFGQITQIAGGGALTNSAYTERSVVLGIRFTY